MPIIGGLINSVPGVSDFIQGLIIFRLFSVAFIEGQLGAAGLPTNIYPGFWESLGYLIITIALIWSCVLGFATLGVQISKNRYYDDESVSTFLTLAILPLAGLLPLFMYAKRVFYAVEMIIR